jgi:phosphate acetyltransferase
MWSGALISTVLGTDFPGPGTIYLGQSLRFRRPVKVGDTVTIKVTAKEKDATKGKVMLDTECINQDGEVVVSGTAEVIAPKEKVQRPKIYLPAVHFDDKEMRFREIMGRVKARKLAPVASSDRLSCRRQFPGLCGGSGGARHHRADLHWPGEYDPRSCQRGQRRSRRV